MGKKKGIKISKVKRSNHLRHKLANKGKFKRNKSKSYIHTSKPQNPQPVQDAEQEEECIGEDMLEMMDKDDLAFLQNSVTSQSYEMLKQIRMPQNRTKSRAVKRVADIDDTLERLYEDELHLPDSKRTKVLLPIKTKEGVIMRHTEVDVEEDEKKELERLKREREVAENKMLKKKEKKRQKREREGKTEEIKDEGEKDADDDLLVIAKENDQVVPKSVAAVDLLACREELIAKKKFQIGLLASGLLEAPELKIRNFKFLLEILNTEHSEVKLTVRKLAAFSLLEVFRDLLPSYQIKHPEVKQGVKLKKATEQLHNYETSLLKAYKMYLQSLEKMTKVLIRKRGDAVLHDPIREKLGLVAVRCMSELVVRHPYFNFAPNIAQALVQFLNNKNPSARETALKGLQTVLREDKRGDLSLHIVRRINHLVRAANHSVRPEVLKVLLALRLKDINLDVEVEAEIRDKKLKAHKKRLINMSRRERKRQKRLEEVEREMLETKAQESKQLKQKNLTEVTKLVFTIFFRVLKKAPSSKLLSVTLEGMAKFAHCINLEFFQDIVNVLDQLLVEDTVGLVEKLHCVLTIFTILSGQGEALNIDPMRFYTHLYQTLLEVHSGYTSQNTQIVLENLEKAVIARRRKVSLHRLMAFVKRLCTCAPHVMHGAALGYLAVVRSIMTQTKSCDILLDTDTSHGDGVYQPELPEPEYCGAGSAVLWELLLLSRHYHPEVRKLSVAVMKNDENIVLPEVSKLSPTQLAKTYDCKEMAFRPAVPPPKQTTPKTHRGRIILSDDDFAMSLKSAEESIKFEDLPEWTIPKIEM